MKAGTFLIILALIIFLSMGLLFLGSITGQAIRGETNEFSMVEAIIGLAIFLLFVEVVIVLTKREKEEVDIKELIRKAQEG